VQASLGAAVAEQAALDARLAANDEAIKRVAEAVKKLSK